MSFSIRNADTNEPVPLEHGKPVWRPIGVHQASAQTWKWSLFIPHLVKGNRGETYEVGGLDTGIEVTWTGNLSTPGEPSMHFNSIDDAKAYAEATVALRMQGDNDG